MEKDTSNKKVLINSVIYSFGGILQKCFSFFLLPLYTSYLTTNDYGITSIATTFITTMGYIVAFSLFSSIMRFYVDFKNDETLLKRFYGTISCFVFISGIFYIVVFTIFQEFISKYIFSGLDFYPLIIVCLIALLFYCQQLIYDNILKSQQKALKSSICSLVFFFVSVLLNIVFVVIYKLGALGTLLASLIAYLIYTMYFWFDMLRHNEICICLDFKLLKEALKYSIPIMPHNLSTTIALLFSKIFIGGKDSLGSLGIYTVASQFGGIADTIQCYVDNAYGPWLYEKLNEREENFKKSISEIVNFLVLVIGLFFLCISLFAHDYIILFVNKDYINAWKYVPMIVSVYAIKTAYYFYVEILFYYKEASKKLFIATLTSSVVNIVLSGVLIPVFGVIGSIFADGISMLIRVLIVVIISKKYESIGLSFLNFVKNFLIIEMFVCLGISLSLFFYPTEFNLINLIFKIFVVICYILYIFISNKDQVSGMSNILLKKMKIRRVI